MAVNLAAQSVDIGAKAGVPLNHFVLDTIASSRFGSAYVHSQPRRYLIGPLINIHPVQRWSIETAFLYRRFGYDLEGSGAAFSAESVRFKRRATGNAWEVPVVWKPRLRFGPMEGFLGAGFAIRQIGGVQWRERRETQVLFQPPPPRMEEHQSTEPMELNRRTAIGAVLSAGLEFRTRRIVLSPEIRYTRWDSSRAGDDSSVRYKRDQVDVALNIAFTLGNHARKPMLHIKRLEPGVLLGFAPLAEFHLPATYRYEKRLNAYGASITFPLPRRTALEFSFLTRTFAYVNNPALYKGRIWEPSAIVNHDWRGWFAGAGLALRRANHLTFREFDITWARGAWGPALQGGREWRPGPVHLRLAVRYHLHSQPLWAFTPNERGRKQSLYILFGLISVRSSGGDK
ncbi:MAG: hypothetical protein JST93_28500 [Acidobacteria bacterium]|nr:hypothetical protein [Acidobacteriota bacterium]